MTELAVGISTPWDMWSLDVDARRARMGRIADAGLDHVFCADHVSFRGGSGSDGIVQLAALSGLEPRVGLYLGVYLLALRHPVVAARALVTLEQAAPGRVTFGVGVGGEDRTEIEACDVDPSRRGRRTDVGLGIVRDLLAGETVSGDGEFFHFRDVTIRPVPSAPIPVIVGGRSDAALARAAALGDGWLAAWCSARRFAEGIAIVEEAADRPPAAGWRHGIQLWVGVGEDAEDGRANVADGMARFYRMPFEPFERHTPVGRPDQIADFLAPYVEAGATTLNLAPCGPSREAEIDAIAEVKRLLA